MDLSSVVSCAIHPAIGVARVGNSPTEYFVGPEGPGIPTDPPGGYKDAQGRIKRQAARFRVYGFDAAGKVVGELTAADAEIAWTVHLANAKAAWYTFQFSMDVPEAQDCERRNKAYRGSRRQQLIIDPGPRTISNTGSAATFNTGTFLHDPVPLGEIRTDDEGHLLVLGGFGASGTPLPHNPPTTFADNDGWHDDTSDGPVRARVRIGGQTLDAKPAWVIVAPPDYAPGIRSVVTMYDVVYEVAIKLGAPAPVLPSFTEHIFPILYNFCRLEWVNRGFYLGYGWAAPDHFVDPDLLEKYASRDAANKRQDLFKRFRNPDYRVQEPTALPPMYGDGMDVPQSSSPREWLAVTALQYDWLRRWADGDFDADFDRNAPRSTAIEDVQVEDRPAILDRVALQECLGGAFHPGCEATWPMRHTTLYSEPFRIKLRSGPAPDYGDTLTPAKAVATDGPLNGSGPGDITKWMAVPWQTDTASCGSGYDPDQDPNLPTFWPARVPNHVLSDASYQQVMRADLSLSQRLKYLSLREDWLRQISQDYQQRLKDFVKEWDKVGIITRRDGPGDDHFPSEIYAEAGNSLIRTEADQQRSLNPRTDR